LNYITETVYRSWVVNDAWLTVVSADLCADRCQFWASDAGTEALKDPEPHRETNSADFAYAMADPRNTEKLDNELEALLLVVFNSKFMDRDGRWPEFYIRLCILQVRV
jgi:hypothetical protein